MPINIKNQTRCKDIWLDYYDFFKGSRNVISSMRTLYDIHEKTERRWNAESWKGEREWQSLWNVRLTFRYSSQPRQVTLQWL